MTNSSLPTFNAPVHYLNLPSTKKQVAYRPFRVKEEKLFLLSTQAAEKEDQYKLIETLIDACTFGKLNMASLTSFDIEYLFTRIYAKSKGEVLNLTFHCTNVQEDGTPCGRTSNCYLNIPDTEVDFPEGFSSKIMLDETQNIGVVMKPVGFEAIRRVLVDSKEIKASNTLTEEEKLDKAFAIIAENIECIFQGETVYEAKDHTTEEIVAFISQMTGEQFDKLDNYFATYPKLKGKVDYVCACGRNKESYKVEGLLNFLA